MDLFTLLKLSSPIGPVCNQLDSWKHGYVGIYFDHCAGALVGNLT